METVEINIPLKEDKTIAANIFIPQDAKGLVLFAHGSGSSRHSVRNNYVAEILNASKSATILADLLTPKEDEVYKNRFDIPLLSSRLIKITEWALTDSSFHHLPIAYFGASTGSAAALQAAAMLGETIKAVVSRGGRPDLAMPSLKYVKSPTLLIVGSLDKPVIELNEKAYQQMECTRKIEIVKGASHLFEEPGTLDQVAELAAGWFEQYLFVHALLEK